MPSFLKPATLVVALLGLISGFVLPYLGHADLQPLAWGAGAGFVLAVLLVEIGSSLLAGKFGLDIVAALSMSAALLFGENLAAAVVALMYAGGQFLEAYAEQRARADMQELLARAPKTALRYANGQLATVPIDDIKPGDRLLVRQGEMVPADGVLLADEARMDLSALTGESAAVALRRGQALRSGGKALSQAFDMQATAPAAESAYAGIVRMVQAAQDAKAPMVRLADRYAMWFLLFTVLLAGGTYLVSGDKVRMLAVLVSATPCPLILAVPVAMIAGMGKAARRGVLMKSGAVLETMARATDLVIDKTGTLTRGQAEITRIVPLPGFSVQQVLQHAAALEQASPHVVAQSIIAAAREQGLSLPLPEQALETAGQGLKGKVNGTAVAVGTLGYVKAVLKQRDMHVPPLAEGESLVAVALGGKPAGFLVMADALRPEAAQALQRLRDAGLSRIVLASGDVPGIVAGVAQKLGIAEHHASLEPADKLALLHSLRGQGVTLMVGDGVNDAPALAAADVGVAMGAKGSVAAAESADAVLLVDNIERLAEAVDTAKRTRVIALQSVLWGLGLSALAMVLASLGYLQPVEGALVQEVIDVAVILNALRALR